MRPESDKILKEKLQSLSVQPSPHVWENIEKEINRKPRIAPVWFFAFLSLILVLGSAGGYYAWQNLNADRNNHNSQPLEQDDSQGQGIPSAASETRAWAPNTRPGIASEEAAPETGGAAVSSSRPDMKGNSIVADRTNWIPGKQKAFQKGAKSGIFVEDRTIKERGGQQMSSMASQASLAEKDRLQSSSQENDEKRFVSAPQSQVESDAASFLRHKNVREHFPLASRNPGNPLSETKAKQPCLFNMDPKCSTFGKQRRPITFSLDVFSGPEYTNRKLIAKSIEYSPLAQKRNDTEKYAFGINTGLRLSSYISPNLAIRTGIYYSALNESFYFEDPNAQITREINVVVDTVKQGNNIIYVWDTISIKEYGTRTKSTMNKYRFVDLPLMAGFEFSFNKIILDFNGGISWNLMTHAEGDVLGENGQPIAFSSSDNNGTPIIKRSSGLSLIGSIGFHIPVAHATSFMFEPNFRFVLKPISRVEYPLKQEVFSSGIRLGIRHHF